VLQLVVKSDLAFEPRYLLPGLELALLIVISIASPVRITRESMFPALPASPSCSSQRRHAVLGVAPRQWPLEGTVGKDPVALCQRGRGCGSPS
jgi:hypothetical protein